jgi:outer membrane protein assembly factor BamB
MAKDNLIAGCNGYVVAIEISTGNEVWRTKLREGPLGGSRGSDVSVIIDSDKIFAGCWGRVYALDPGNGNILWSNGLAGIGFNEVALSKQGISTQFITRVEQHSS